MNNFQKIKNMTIDEMAELFSTCVISHSDINCNDSLCGSDRCKNHIKQWLEAESEDTECQK